jgi:Zn-dependent alcohol dehydrogenase
MRLAAGFARRERYGGGERKDEHEAPPRIWRSRRDGPASAGASAARVIVTSRDARKLERAQGLGAFLGIDTSRTPDWAVEALAATDGRGVDHVLEVIGGDNLRQSLGALASEGRIASVVV